MLGELQRGTQPATALCRVVVNIIPIVRRRLAFVTRHNESFPPSPTQPLAHRSPCLVDHVEGILAHLAGEGAFGYTLR